MRLEGKKALVTGAGTGIGREVALELAREGADVVLTYYSSGEGAEAACAEIKAMGRMAATVRANLALVEDCHRAVDEAIGALGGLDILVNNAGRTESGSFYEVTRADFDRLYDINIRGQFFVAQGAARHMRDQGHGVILNMLSIQGLGGFPNHTVYDGTKGAIQAWTRALAVELAPDRIRVVAVAPGAIDVPRQHNDPDYAPARMGKIIPWGRVGYPIDVAKLCAFLVSDDADFIVGETVVADGGTMARLAFYQEYM